MHRRTRLRLQADGRAAGGERGKRPLRRTHPGDLRHRRLCGPRGVCETKDGSITFWAENVPEGGIQMQVELLGPSASTADTGEDTLGDTVLEDTTL